MTACLNAGGRGSRVEEVVVGEIMLWLLGMGWLVSWFCAGDLTLGLVGLVMGIGWLLVVQGHEPVPLDVCSLCYTKLGGDAPAHGMVHLYCLLTHKGY